MMLLPGTTSRAQGLLFICLLVCLLALVTNTYVLLAIQKSLNLDNLRSVMVENIDKFARSFAAELPTENRISHETASAEAREVLATELSQSTELHHPAQETAPFEANKLFSVGSFSPDVMPFILQKNLKPGFTLGKGRSEKVSVVIGIPSVRRADASYLYETLSSFLGKIYPNNEEKTAFVVFIAEQDDDYVRTEAKYIYGNFTRHVESGLLQVIGPPDNFYPNFDQIEQTLGDSVNRVKWRSKEVVDAALLMFLCREKGEHYLMMEDDVIATKGYMTTLLDFIAKHSSEKYTYLSVTTLNSIGKLFPEPEITVWVSYFLTFYNMKPIDWLMLDFLQLKHCHVEMTHDQCEHSKKIAVPQLHYSPFQHIGKVSSLVGKTQVLDDRSFRDTNAPQTKHVNPTAEISTSIKSMDVREIESCYRDSGGLRQHFTSLDVKPDDVITFAFSRSQTVNRILIKSGQHEYKTKYRLCQSCAELEILSSRNHRDSERYERCAYSDANGEMECSPSTPIIAFRVRFRTKLTARVHFELVYVQT